jgi:hypothetical protein
MVDLTCVIETGEKFRDEATYQQASFKATTPDCRWISTVVSTDEKMTIHYEFIVWPLRAPTHEGTLVVLDTLNWAETQVFTVAADELITVRLTETEIGFGWEHPTYQWKCAEVINDNLGTFTTGYKQWLIKAGNTA